MVANPLPAGDFSNIPLQLRALPRWLLWRKGPRRKGKTTKIPVYASGKMRGGTPEARIQLDSPDDLCHLVTFNEAFDTLLTAEDGDFEGLGFALVADDGIGAFDLDDCLDDEGRLKRTHAGFTIAGQAKLAGAYTEISPSGFGLRILGPCSIPDAYSLHGLEFWGEKRFVTITGEVYANPQGWKDLTELRGSIRPAREPVERPEAPEDGIIPPRVVEELKSALQAIDSDERELWIKIGMAMKSMDHPEAQAMWLEWSARSDKFDLADANRVWETLNPQNTSYKAVFAEAQDNWYWDNPARGKRRSAQSAFQDEEDEDTQTPARNITLQANLLPTEFILDGFLPTGVSVVAGAWGAGKSTNLIPLLCSAAHLTPEEWGFWPDIRRKVLWVTEAPEQAQDTIYSLLKAEGSADLQSYRDWFLLYRAERVPAKKLARNIERQVQALTYPMDNGFEVRPVVVLDTTSANIEMENESDNSQVSAAMAILKQRLPGVSLVLVGHTPKALCRSDVKDMTFRGAGAWEADAVATYFLIHDEELDMRFLALRKSRFAPDYREISFDSDKGSLIIDTPWGEPQAKGYLHGVPKRSNGEERKAARREIQAERQEQRKERTLTDRQTAVLEAIARGTTAGRFVGLNRIKEEVGGKAELLSQALIRLEEAGLVDLHPIPLEFVKSGRPGTFYLPEGVDLELFIERVKGSESPPKEGK